MVGSIRYSHRIAWNASTNEITRGVERLRSEHRELLDLTSSNPTTVGLDYPHEEIRDAFAEIRNYKYEPVASGLFSARQAICDYYGQRGTRITAEQVVCTASTSEAYTLLFKLFCDAGDQVLCPVPSYPLFEYLAGCEMVQTVPYSLRYDGAWFIDLENLDRSIAEQSRAIITVNPNNPTGSSLRKPDWNSLAQIAATRNLPLISDEVFMDFTLRGGGDRISTLAGQETALSFSLNGLSKCVGMPQLKLGWIVISGPERERDRARDRLETLLDTYLSVNTPVQLALPKLFAIGQGMQKQLQQRTHKNLAQADELLGGSAAHVLHAEGGWSAILHLPNVLEEEEWVFALLQESGVLVQPGFLFDMRSGSFVVASLITPPDIFAEGISRIRKLVEQRVPSGRDGAITRW